MKKPDLKKVLDGVYSKYNVRSMIQTDPLMFVYDYHSAGDMELAGFIAASFAYGKVAMIQRFLRELFSLTGPDLAEFVGNYCGKDARKITGLKYRFNTGVDISNLFCLLKYCLEESGSIEIHFSKFYSPQDENILPGLEGFCNDLLTDGCEKNKITHTRGLKYFLVSPSGKSPCKRMNMFLRWMIRKDEVDPGVWTRIPASKLVVPLDTHMIRLCRILGLHSSNSASLSTAVEVTRNFAKISPDDPAKYDFSLCRIGIVNNCNGLTRPRCKGCELYSHCM